MSTLNAYAQSTIERKRYTISYARWLDSGETLFDHSFITSPSTEPALTIEDAFSTNGDTEITFFVRGGVGGMVYDVKVVATTSDGQIKEDTIAMEVFDA